jgi:hypothetical protein
MSILLGSGAAISCFATLSIYLERLFNNSTSKNYRSRSSKKISEWWDSAYETKPSSIIFSNLQVIPNLFIKNENPKLLIVFYSFCFTLSSLVVGDFFSSIGSYLYIYCQIPQNITQGITGDTNLYICHMKAGYYYCIITLFNSSFVLYILFSNWKRKNSYKIIYSFIVNSIILILIAKCFTIYSDTIAGLYTLHDNSLLWMLIINSCIFIIFYKPISDINTLKKCIIVSIFILVINLILISILPYTGLFNSFIIDGIINRFFALYAINLVFDYITVRIILKYRHYLNVKSIVHLFSYLLIVTATCLFASIMTFITYSFYIYNIQSAIPRTSINPTAILQYNFIEWFYGILIYSLSGGQYTAYFYAFSTFIPLCVLFMYTIFYFIIKSFKKLSAHFIFILYQLSNPTDKDSLSIVPIYIIAIFISVLILIGTTHVSYITFISFYDK